MSLDTKMNDALKEAMKSKDPVRLRTLRSIKSAFLLAKTAEGAHGKLSEEDELKILQKLHKQRKDSYDIYIKEGRDDLAAAEKEEMDVLEDYLPAQLSEDELLLIVQSVITQTGADSMKDMGKVMGQVMGKVAGKADGKRVSAAVKKLLSQ